MERGATQPLTHPDLDSLVYTSIPQEKCTLRAAPQALPQARRWAARRNNLQIPFQRGAFPRRHFPASLPRPARPCPPSPPAGSRGRGGPASRCGAAARSRDSRLPPELPVPAVPPLSQPSMITHGPLPPSPPRPPPLASARPMGRSPGRPPAAAMAPAASARRGGLRRPATGKERRCPRAGLKSLKAGLWLGKDGRLAAG